MSAPWEVVRIVRVVDGDSLWLTRRRVVGEADGLRVSVEDTEPVNVRLVHVDTPERADLGAWVAARRDLELWVGLRTLRFIPAGRDPFGRRLADLEDVRTGQTASDYLIRERGWHVYGAA